MFHNNSIERIFRLGVEDLLDAEDEGYVKQEDEVNSNLEDKVLTEGFEIFSRYQNSIVGHFGISNTLKAKLWGHQWRNMHNDIINWIQECAIYQKIKLRTSPIWRDEVEHHLYHLEPLASLSVDTLVHSQKIKMNSLLL